METKLVFEFKTVFGRELAYPVNEQAIKILKIIDRKKVKALNMDQIRSLEDMGFEIVKSVEGMPWIIQTNSGVKLE